MCLAKEVDFSASRGGLQLVSCPNQVSLDLDRAVADCRHRPVLLSAVLHNYWQSFNSIMQVCEVLDHADVQGCSRLSGKFMKKAGILVAFPPFNLWISIITLKY